MGWKDKYTAYWKQKDAIWGVCNFEENYNFFFKWLLNKVMSCFVIKNCPETFDDSYFKATVLMDGNCGVGAWDDKLYAVTGAVGGEPDEYYIPTLYTVANPILGSRQIRWRPLRDQTEIDGVVIFNTDIDKTWTAGPTSGLYELINQTAAMLADNIISINCQQINSRAHVFFTAESEAQAASGEAALKKMYSGKPFQVLRSDIVEKINVNPIASTTTSSNITELVALHNYIVSNFFQSIGIKSNNIRKNAHVLQDEIDSQEDLLQISVLEILTSWQKGFDEVNKLFGTDIQVELNPVLIHEIADSFIDSAPEFDTPDPPAEETNDEEVSMTDEEEQPKQEQNETDAVEQEEDPQDVLDEVKEIVEAIVEEITETEEGDEVEDMQLEQDEQVE